MNFIDYCIATKNYSVLNAVSEYSKVFARTNPGITDPIKRKMAVDYLNGVRNRVRRKLKDKDEITDKFDRMDEYQKAHYLTSLAFADDFRKNQDWRNNDYRKNAKRIYKETFGDVPSGID